MQIIIKTKDVELTPPLENFIQKRMTSVAKMVNAFQKSAELLVEVARETRHHKKGDIFKAEVIILLPGKKLVAESRRDDLRKAITEVKEELQRELRKYKTKTIELPRRRYRKEERNNL